MKSNNHAHRVTHKSMVLFALLLATTVLLSSCNLFQRVGGTPIEAAATPKDTVSMEETEESEAEEEEPVIPAPVSIPWELKLVRMEYPMSQADEPELADFRDGIQLDARIIDAAESMFAAAEEEGLSPIACSGFRSYQTQLRLFNNKVTREMNDGLDDDEAFYSAKTVVALPGSSEHQTGLAIDIVAESYQSLDEGIEETDEIKWFYEHCTEYGFIVRYPNGKSNITGIVYEPWHFRYVGKEVAEYIREHEITFEEYYQDHLTTETLNLIQVLD